MVKKITLSFLILIPVISIYGQEIHYSKKESLDAIKDLAHATKTYVEKFDQNGQAKMNILLGEFENHQKNLEEILLKLQAEEEEKELQDILDKFSKNNRELKYELVLWKYVKKETSYMELFYMLEVFKQKSIEVKNKLVLEKDYEDPFTRLMSEDHAEEVVKIGDEIIKNIGNL